MARCIEYPAANSADAEARARADAEEHNWEVVAADWVASLHGNGLQFEEGES